MAGVFADHELILLTPIVRLLGAFLDTSFKDWRALYFEAGVMVGWWLDRASEAARCRNIPARSASRSAQAFAPNPEGSETVEIASHSRSGPPGLMLTTTTPGSPTSTDVCPNPGAVTGPGSQVTQIYRWDLDTYETAMSGTGGPQYNVIWTAGDPQLGTEITDLTTNPAAVDGNTPVF